MQRKIGEGHGFISEETQVYEVSSEESEGSRKKKADNDDNSDDARIMDQNIELQRDTSVMSIENIVSFFFF